MTEDRGCILVSDKSPPSCSGLCCAESILLLDISNFPWRKQTLRFGCLLTDFLL